MQKKSNLSRRRFVGVGAAVALGGILAGCSSDAASDDATTDGGSTEDTTADDADTEDEGADEDTVIYSYDGNDFRMQLSGADELYTTCDEQGTVESLTYDTRAYFLEEALGEESLPLTKTLYVYLPYGYDESTQYNVLYLMHGGGENEGYWLTTDDDNKGTRTCALLDNLVKDGKCANTIVVTPTFTSIPEGYEEAAEEVLSADYDDNDSNPNVQMTECFWQELRNEIIPLVEAAYPTYAGGDVSEEGLQASRDHRAFAGLSLGSCTTFRAAMLHNTDLFAYFGNYSGALTSAEQIEEALTGEFADYEIKYWYNGNGTNDVAHDEHLEVWETVCADLPDRFQDVENTCWVDFDGGAHAFSAWIIDLYNCMLVFFKK